MEGKDDHRLDLSLTLKCPPPPAPTPRSQYLPSQLLQVFPHKFTHVPYNLHTLLPPNHPARRSPPNHNPHAELDKEIQACMDAKRRRAAELKERVREHRRERERRREAEGEVAVLVSSPPNSTVSTTSLSGNKRKEREEENNIEAEKDLSSKDIVMSEDEDGGDAAARKKLILSKEQAAVLEETFKDNNTLTTEKVALAKQLDLRPRQVEVWFQNRRARTKLKQTEVDYGYMKVCCEVIGEENRRLKKELAELRALKHSHQSYVNMFPFTTLIMCPRCARVAKPASSTRASSVVCAVNTNHQDLAGPSHPKSTSGIPFAKLEGTRRSSPTTVASHNFGWSNGRNGYHYGEGVCSQKLK